MCLSEKIASMLFFFFLTQDIIIILFFFLIDRRYYLTRAQQISKAAFQLVGLPDVYGFLGLQ